MIEELKIELKLLLTREINDALGKIEITLSRKSEQFNTFIQHKARVYKIINDDINGIVSYTEKTLELNKIRFSIVQYIDTLTETDFDYDKLKDYKFEYLKKLTSLEDESLGRYIKYTKYLNRLPSEDRLRNQIRLTKNRLIDLGYRVEELKTNLKNLNYFKGDIDNNEINKELIESIMLFQSAENVIPIDGIYGKVTHEILIQIIQMQN